MVATIGQVTNQIFDYLVVGGGTAGLTVAARLSENPSVSVLVLEHGPPNLNDPVLTNPGQLMRTFKNPKYDWDYLTEPQPFSANRQFAWNRGKGLGGTSHMNYMTWTRPPSADVDAFEKLGNPGWNGANFVEYSRLSENFVPAAGNLTNEYPFAYNPDFRGTGGPIQNTVAQGPNYIDRLFHPTLIAAGINDRLDAYGGDPTGAFMTSSTIDPKTWTRSYSASAHYLPNANRTNLYVLTNATVAKVLFDDKKIGKDIRASGVEFLYKGKRHQSYVIKDVVLSAGAINSPQLLELSGIGRRDVLKQIGVKVKVELPGVGENVQEHTVAGMSYELDPKYSPETYGEMLEAFAVEAKGQHVERVDKPYQILTSFAYVPLAMASNETSSVIKKAEDSVTALKKTRLSPGLAEQYDIQLESLRDTSIPDLQVVAFPGFLISPAKPQNDTSYISLLFVNNHPFSRGHIHAVSKDPFVHPKIDPAYFEVDDDLENLVQHVKFIRTFSKLEPWKSNTLREVEPGPGAQTDEQIRDFIRAKVEHCYHTIGSASMLPREKNGVVNPQLIVYGTSNLRVVDLSVLPIHVAAHTQSSAYAVAEKAADLIRGISRV